MTSLRLRMLEEMQIRNLAVNTQESYVQQVSLFARYFNQSPEQLGPEQIRTYQLYLTKEKKLATSSILMAISALRFLYRVTLKKDWTFEGIIPPPKKPQTLPVVLSPEEVVQFLACVANRKHRAILTTCYGAGLRVSEAIALTPPAIDRIRCVYCDTRNNLTFHSTSHRSPWITSKPEVKSRPNSQLRGREVGFEEIVIEFLQARFWIVSG
jgi:integrase/recombinase XerD